MENSTTTTKKGYLPWILAGGVAVAAIAYYLYKQNTTATTTILPTVDPNAKDKTHPTLKPGVTITASKPPVIKTQPAAVDGFGGTRHIR